MTRPDAKKVQAVFARHVRKAFPEGRASEDDRKRLLEIAAKAGLTTAQAEAVLSECLVARALPAETPTPPTPSPEPTPAAEKHPPGEPTTATEATAPAESIPLSKPVADPGETTTAETVEPAADESAPSQADLTLSSDDVVIFANDIRVDEPAEDAAPVEPVADSVFEEPVKALPAEGPTKAHVVEEEPPVAEERAATEPVRAAADEPAKPPPPQPTPFRTSEGRPKAPVASPSPKSTPWVRTVVALLVIAGCALALYLTFRKSPEKTADEPAVERDETPANKTVDTPESEPSTPPVAAVPTPSPSQPEPAEPAPKRPSPSAKALLRQLLLPSASDEDLRRTLDRADAAELTAALASASGLLMGQGTMEEVHRARRIFEVVATSPPPKTSVQDAAVMALMERTRGLKNNRAYDANHPVNVLSSMLFLKSTTSYGMNRSVPSFDVWEREWQQSRRSNPSDPINDPKRLAYALMSGGNLQTYAGRADDERLQAVTSRLSDMAVDSSVPQGRSAFQCLRNHAQRRRVGSMPAADENARRAHRAVQLALCRFLRKTEDGRLAGEASQALRTSLSMRYSTTRAGSVATAAERVAAADRMERLVRGKPPEDWAGLLDDIMDGVPVETYADKLTDAQVAGAIAALVDAAVDSRNRNSYSSMSKLRALAKTSAGADEKKDASLAKLRKAARIGLCQVIRDSTNKYSCRSLAGNLADILGLAGDHPLRHPKVDTPQQRKETAAEFEKIIASQ